MLRKISVAGKESDLDLEIKENGDVVFRLDEQNGCASIVEVRPRVYSVLLEGRSYEARIISANGAVVVEINGHRYPVTVEDPRRSRRGAAGGAPEGRTAVQAPMPGRIVRVLAREGEMVAAGQGLVVIEAMKMQNELKSPRAGSVVSVPVKEGETVAAGAVLAVVE